MLTDSKARSDLLALLRRKSVFHGDFVLSSGARSNYYIDCRLTTLDGEGAWLVGEVMHSLILGEARARNLNIDAVGGLTMGADPIALATCICSYRVKDAPPLRCFVVRKAAKDHGKGKLIEGNFKSGDIVAVLDDVITSGESTINAIKAVESQGGKVAFAAVLVDRQQGGRQNIEALGLPVVSAFVKDELL